jgi:hypothetical protein
MHFKSFKMYKLKFIIRILLQFFLFVASHSLLLLATLSPVLIIGIITVSIIVAISTFYLWKNVSRDVQVRSLFLMLIAEFIFIYEVDSLDFISKAKIYFSNMNNFLLSALMILIIFYLLISSLKTVHKKI